MKRSIVLAILSAHAARADDVLRLHAHGEDAEPYLHVDPALEPTVETALAIKDRASAAFDLGQATTAVLTSEHWIDDTTYARGVTGGLHLSHDFGAARVSVGGSVSRVDSRFEAATYVDLTVALTKVVPISRWTTGWISLGLDYRKWIGEPTSAVGVMLWLGFTFR